MAIKNQNVPGDLCQGRVGREDRKTVAKKGVTAPRVLPEMEGAEVATVPLFSSEQEVCSVC